MENIKKWLEPTKNKVIAGVIAVLVLAGGGFGIWSLTQSKTSELVIVFKENIVLEYGSKHVDYIAVFDGEPAYVIEYDETHQTNESLPSFNFFDFIDNEHSKFDKIGIPLIDTSTLGKKETIVKAKLNDKESEFKLEYEVVDTSTPVIDGAEDMETPYGSELHFEDFITGTDPVDGKTKLVVEGDLDTSKAGQYEMKAIATDNNGNVTEKNFVVTVLEEEKPVEEPEVPTPQAPSNTGGTSSTNKPSSNTGNNNSTSKPVEPSKPAETPKPTEPTKPVEKPKPVEPSKPDTDTPTGMLLFKDYGTFELFNADIHKQAKEHVYEWVRNFCDYDGKMYYKPSN